MYYVTAFYKFVPLNTKDAQRIRDDLYACGSDLNMGGLTIVGTEGINGTVAGSKEAIANWKEKIESTVGDVTFKDSTSNDQPFKRWFVKIRPEIVSLGDTKIIPKGKHNHLSPEDWDRMIDSEDVVILDTRNDYETEIGMFEGAIDPKLHCFQEFPEYVKTCEIPKEKKVLMYCTGGIRCEKACLEMERQGYENVYQLDGGILRYMQERPQKKWKGECFVFDHRVAVNQDLKPSDRYGLCPHCGDPGDQKVTCVRCDQPGMMCMRCLELMDHQTCSKNCNYQLNLALQKAA